ncbi:phosphatidylglycerophosphatase A [Octadecabacter sp. SW4]|uniref:phosphatidylglycerophosphatase A family protein n=1 Tax=Octadecabacter sp. SW4 TaxID=2602067 RepID=UPI0011C1D561|nr:phosphatidylglycerophosphatase A [Octadecabacter sp. SW4]QEE35602.1 phosphatidylglycerophosphatase A [Octadecabacter sp. SW4]|tara:strand:+ start:818 stop:1318 length:501 start_codon:yes stop_codon:yes gene_type:complete
MKDKWAHLTATVFYVGHLRPAPGTWGSLVALPMAWAIYMVGGFWLFALAIPAAYIKGYYATRWMTAGKDNHDPSEIVIDEVVGQWIALLPVIYGIQVTGAAPLSLWPGWLVAFALFRWFDITKPGFVGWADRKDNATGVMLDDVIAGIFAAIGVVALASLYHQFLL